MNEPTTEGKQDQRQTFYRSYLLRLWCTEQSESDCWRASLEDPHTGKRVGFANLGQLFAFLMEQIEDVK